MIDMTPVVRAIIVLLCAIITCVLVPLIRSKTTLSQRQELADWVQTAVTAAEQIYKGAGRGEEKKLYVQTWLRERNIVINDSEIDAMIESAVHNLNSGTWLLGEAVEATTGTGVMAEEGAT